MQTLLVNLVYTWYRYGAAIVSTATTIPRVCMPASAANKAGPQRPPPLLVSRRCSGANLADAAAAMRDDGSPSVFCSDSSRESSLFNSASAESSAPHDGGSLQSLSQVLLAASKTHTAVLDLTSSRPFISEDDIGAITYALRQNQAMMVLKLGGNALWIKRGVAIAEAVPFMQRLETLDLSGNKLGAAAGLALADALKRNPALLSLSVADNFLSIKGGVAMAGAISRNVVLTSLNLENNYLKPTAAKAIAFALELSAGSRLQSCGMLKNHLDAEAVAKLVQVLEGHKVLRTLCGIEPGQTYRTANAEVDFHNRDLDSTDGMLIAAEIRLRSELQRANLRGNNIGCARHLLEAVVRDRKGFELLM